MRSISISAIGFLWRTLRGRGLSQDKLGALIGVTFQQIQKYERGANRISASRLIRLAQVLDLPPAYFFENITCETSNASPTIDVYLLEREARELLRLYYSICDPRTRRFSRQMISNLSLSEHGGKRYS